MIAWLSAAIGALSLATSLARLRTRPVRRPYSEPRARPRAISEALGWFLRRALRHTPNVAVDRHVGRVVLAGSALVMVSPLLGPIGALGLHTVWILRRRREGRAALNDMVDGLAQVLDLFVMALVSGLTVNEAVDQSTRWAPQPFADAFVWCVDQTTTGRPLGDALEDLPGRLGSQVRPLVAALVAHDRYGAPIVSNLKQLAADARSDRRRRAESAARRLPVTLLFPLVVCVLPAFMLLTVVPVIAETLASIEFLASP